MASSSYNIALNTLKAVVKQQHGMTITFHGLLKIIVKYEKHFTSTLENKEIQFCMHCLLPEVTRMVLQFYQYSYSDKVFFRAREGCSCTLQVLQSL